MDVPDGVEELDPAQLAPGFRAGAVACGLKGGATDVGVLVCDDDSVRSALALTANASAAAPVRLCRAECDQRAIRAVAVNSGNANAATGEQGYRDAAGMRDAAAEALSLEPATVAVAETGTIGVPLEADLVIPAVGQAAARVAGGGVLHRLPRRQAVRRGEAQDALADRRGVERQRQGQMRDRPARLDLDSDFEAVAGSHGEPARSQPQAHRPRLGRGRRRRGARL